MAGRRQAGTATTRTDGQAWHRGLDRDIVVGEALRILDEEGRGALTMRNLARALHVEAASLYAHVAGKDELVGAALDRVLDAIELPPPTNDGRADLVAGFSTYRRGLLAHPECVMLITERARFSSSQARLATRSITLLEAAGLSTRAAVDAHVTLIAMTLGFILQEVARPAPTPRELLEAEPVLRRALPALAQRSVDDRFETALQLILDGALGRRQKKTR
jgi:AcrR family transcriptional regulator